MRSKMSACLRGVLTATVLLAGTTFHAPLTHAGGDWNDGNIAWKSYDEGLAAAKKEKKPVCLIFYTEWCPHCANYSRVFHDAKVVEKSKEFIMIRLDKDKNAEISKKYAPDGEYIPRTYFLTSDGTLDPEIHAPRPQYKYFYDEAQPGAVLGGMDAALKKFKAA
jgi:glutaredoxin